MFAPEDRGQDMSRAIPDVQYMTWNSGIRIPDWTFLNGNSGLDGRTGPEDGDGTMGRDVL